MDVLSVWGLVFGVCVCVCVLSEINFMVVNLWNKKMWGHTLHGFSHLVLRFAEHETKYKQQL